MCRATTRQPDRQHQADETPWRRPEGQRESDPDDRVRGEQRHQSRKRQRERRHALRGRPRARAARCVFAQPVGVADRIPRPARDRADGQQRARSMAREVHVRPCAQFRELDVIHERDPGGDQQQRRRELQPWQAAVAPRVAQVRRDRDDDRQRADDHRRQRSAGALDRGRQQHVVEEVADRGELARLDPVGARELADARPVEPRERQRDQPEAT